MSKTMSAVFEHVITLHITLLHRLDIWVKLLKRCPVLRPNIMLVQGVLSPPLICDHLYGTPVQLVKNPFIKLSTLLSVAVDPPE